MSAIYLFVDFTDTHIKEISSFVSQPHVARSYVEPLVLSY